jgi:hypothetical protein
MEDDTLTVSAGHAGAVTISIYRHSDPSYRVDPAHQCRRFAQSRGATPEIETYEESAYSSFKAPDGVLWLVRVIGSGARFALATFNSTLESDPDKAEAMAIIGSVTLLDEQA